MEDDPKLLAQSPLDVWSLLLDKTELEPRSRFIATARVANTAASLKKRVTRLLWAYRVGKMTVTVGALLVPALTGLDSARAQPQATFWLIWGLSLATGAGNAFISLFGIDRKYFMLKEQLMRLEGESWLFLSLSGKYKKGGSHQEQFSTFMEKCEAILDKAVRLQDGHPKNETLPPDEKSKAVAEDLEVAAVG
jgi:Protein of unknown function (DUF4231)